MGVFSLLSLNTFAVPFYLGWERLGRLAEQLDGSPYDVICLQEIQQNAYAGLLRRKLASYPHSAYVKHWYAPQGGLVAFSRIPLQERSFSVFRQRGAWLSISLADWGLYKGIQALRFKVDGMSIYILNTHLHANYSGVWHLKNRLSRILLSQVQQLVQSIHSCPVEALVVACGDFNFPRDSFLYRELIDKSDLCDPLAEDLRPTYRPFPLVPEKWKTSLDYVILRKPAGMKIEVIPDLLEIEDASKDSHWQRFLTDHNALVLQVNWDNRENTGPSGPLLFE